jgi:hypothetical protein
MSRLIREEMGFTRIQRRLAEPTLRYKKTNDVIQEFLTKISLGVTESENRSKGNPQLASPPCEFNHSLLNRLPADLYPVLAWR